MEIQKVKLLGQEHAVVAPSFAEREEIALAYATTRPRGGVALLRAYAAAIGLSTRIGRQCKVDYAACKCDPLVYGGQVYGWLRERKVSPEEIAVAGLVCVQAAVTAMAPREPEVQAAADFTGPAEG